MGYKLSSEQEKPERNGVIHGRESFANTDNHPVTPEIRVIHEAIAPSPITAKEFELEPEEFLPPKTAKHKQEWLTPAFIGMIFGIVTAFVGMHVASSKNNPKTAIPQKAKSTHVSMTVTTAPVETTSVVRNLETTGTVAAAELLPVLPQSTGLQIKQVLIHEGQPVKTGQVMAVLDDAILQTQHSGAQAQLEASKAAVQQKQAALIQAKAVLMQAQADVGKAQANHADARAKFKDAQTNLKRYQTLAEQGAISSQDLDTRLTTAESAAEAVRVAEAGIKSAQANISSAQANISSAQADVRSNLAKIQQIKTQLGQTLVVASANGIVVAPNNDGRCDVNPAAGMAVTASQAVVSSIARVGDTSGSKAFFCIIRNSALELQVKVPEAQLKEVNVGAPVTITRNGDNRIQLQGTVREISPMVDPQTRQATIKIDIPASDTLKPGMFLKVAVTAQTDKGLAVPATAVQRQTDGKPFVYLIDANDIVHAQPVEVGSAISGDRQNLLTAKTEIKSGLKLGDRVVVAGAGYLKDSEKVRVFNRR